MSYGWLIYDREGADRNRWFIERLIHTAQNRGLSLELVITDELAFGLQNNQLFIQGGDKKLKPEFAIVRTIFPLLSLHLEKMGIQVFNSARVSAICNDKRLTHLFASALDLPMMDTLFCDRLRMSHMMVEFPCIVKSSNGHGGKEVFWVDTAKQLEEAIGSMQTHEYLIQKPASDRGRDLRVYMIGGEIIASILRSSDQSFKSNFTLGGKASVYDLAPTQREIVYKIASHLNADMIGIDFVFDHGRFMLNEIEDVVGTRMIYNLTDIDIIALFIDHIRGRLK